MTSPDPDIRELDRRAVQLSVEVVAQASPEDLGRPTPCSAWTLGDLLAHMTAQHHGFAAAAQGRGEDLAAWAVRPSGPDAVARYRAAAGEVTAAFAGLSNLDARFTLPEVSTEFTFSARRAIGFHFIDYVVHAWDVARALRQPYLLPDGFAPMALTIAAAVPDGENRLRPNASFAPGRPAADDQEPLDRVLALLGRSPTWPD
jgi:uncharacterized protein (TIGR03086 family)